MSDSNDLNSAELRITRTPGWLASRQPVTPPRKALILQPFGVDNAMLATPLLAALSDTFPDARFDWLVHHDAAPAIVGNPRLRRLIRLDALPSELTGRTAAGLIERLRQEQYDTCFLPDSAGNTSAIARRASIPQRIGLASGNLELDATIVVQSPSSLRHRAARNLAIAAAVGVEDSLLQSTEAEFYPSDADRTAVTRWLVEELDWLGDTPLVVIHPGGVGEGAGPAGRRWPAVRFARLANYLGRTHGARIILVGDSADRTLAAEVAGMVSVPVANRAGRIGLGEVGALGEFADLYVGNDAGSTHVAAASGCPTLVIFGPTDPAVSAPYTRRTPVEVLWMPLGTGGFTWENGITVEQAADAAGRLLGA